MEKTKWPGTPPPKKQRLSLSLKKKQQDRFGSVTWEDFELAAEGVVPENTKFSNNWAARTFQTWAEQRNLKEHENSVPEDLLWEPDAERLCHFLRLFVLETRRTDGKTYPPATLNSLLRGVNRVLLKNQATFSILNNSDHRFRAFHLTLDSISSDLHRQGVGTARKGAALFNQIRKIHSGHKEFLEHPPLKSSSALFSIALVCSLCFAARC